MDIVSSIVAGGSLAVSLVTLIVTRLDRHREMLSRQQNYRTALLDLESTLASWVRVARATDQIAKAYLEGTASYEAVLRAAIRQDIDLFGAREIPIIEEQFGPERDYSIRRKNFDQFLQIYAPEFAGGFSKAAHDRHMVLADIPRLLDSHGLEIINALDAAVTELHSALLMLRKFIRETVPPTSAAEP